MMKCSNLLKYDRIVHNCRPGLFKWRMPIFAYFYWFLTLQKNITQQSSITLDSKYKDIKL